MLRFQKLEVGGYKSWGWPAITIDLNSGGVNQIAGDNASGKTNLIECFYWVLTGKQIKGLKVDKVINWRHRKKGAFGATELLSNGDHYRIERYRGHPRHQNALLLFKDGVPEAEDRPQEELDRLIGLAPDELLASIVFSAEDFKNIIEMPVDKRRNFMERMFGVDRFDAILPPGTGAILAVAASRPTGVAGNDGSISVKRQMQVNLTADHRVIYGADGAAFLKDLAELIETRPESLAL